jgi:hypothetical protein
LTSSNVRLDTVHAGGGDVNLYAFDIDHTLEVSGGPIPVESMRKLAAEGHIVGLCGNWAVVTRAVPDWYRFISFVGPMAMTKADFLGQLRLHVGAVDYVMVGNSPRYSSAGLSDDEGAAALAGWRFIPEQAFAAGER